MKTWRLLWIVVLAVTCSAQTKLKTKNVVVITTDGVRWEDVFRGPDETLMNREVGGVREAVRAQVRAEYLRTTAEENRRNWMPFFWNVVAQQGQVYGNQDKGSVARITNTFRFSYPGYNEIFTGRFDPQINTNDFGPNPNVTVFEWLNQIPEFKGKVSALGAWFAFPNIFNRERSGIFARGQWEPPTDGKSPLTPEEARLDELYRTTIRQWSYEIPDSFLQLAVKDHVKRHRPRVLFVGYGETDSWAHLGRFDQHLRSAKLVDQFIGDLWNLMQSMPQYRGTTTFIITTDHGRGQGPDWKNHGDKIAGAENIWIAVLGPDTPALGERSNIAPVTQAQVAATVAALLGKDYFGAMKEKGVAEPLAEVVRKP
jgi:hypothetical protein